MGSALKRIVPVLALWVGVSAATVRCGSSTFDDDDVDRNRPPVASSSFLETRLGQPVSDRMQASDPDGDLLSFRVTAGPDAGSLTGLDDRGFFTYVPAVPGTDQFSFRASDGRLESNTAQVVIRVTPLAAAAKPPRPAGVAAVLADPVSAAGVLLLWSGPDGALVRLPPPGAGLPQTLLPRAVAVAGDPWRPGRIVALRPDGELIESVDGGGAWRAVARIAPPAAGTALALGDARVLVARPDAGCRAATGRAGGLRIDEVCGRAPIIGPDGVGYALTGPPDAGVLRRLGGPGETLATAVLHAGADPLLPARLWVVQGPADGAVLRRSDDGGAAWGEPVPLPAGTVTDAVGHPSWPGPWVALAGRQGALTVFRFEADGWRRVAELPAAAGRLLPCGRLLCVLGPGGARLWRVDPGTGGGA